MATKQADELLKAPEPAGQLPPHIECVFTGAFYKSVSKDVNEPQHFEITVKVPTSVISRDVTPPYVFKRFYAGKVLGQQPGYSGVRSVFLKSTVGEIPYNLPLRKQLNWMTDTVRLRTIAESQRGSRPVYNEEGEVVGSEEVKIDIALYSNPADLAAAIKRLLDEPDAFAKEQEEIRKLANSSSNDIESEIALLNPFL
jgi:hypothetical protein